MQFTAMKPFDQLTFLGRMRRMRRLAHSALAAYDLNDPQLRFLRHAGNTLFQVNETNPCMTPKNHVYVPGQYALRIHQPGYQTPAAIASEMEWLLFISQKSNLPVPQPVRNRSGALCTQITIPGVPKDRTVSLLRWVRGRELERASIRSHHYKALGELTAKLHHHSSHWQPPSPFTKRKYDWEGLFLKEGSSGELTREAWSLLPLECVAPFNHIAQRVKRVMDQMGKDPCVYGLIHADLGMGANVIFWHGDARVIDFDDSGFGYYLFDLAIILEDSQDHQIQPHFRDALLDGYLLHRSLSDDEIQYLDLFLAAYAVFWCLFAVDAVRYHPEDRIEIFERVDRYYRLVQHFLDHH